MANGSDIAGFSQINTQDLLHSYCVTCFTSPTLLALPFIPLYPVSASFAFEAPQHRCFLGSIC